MQIGSVPNPQSWERWPEAEALLQPAFALSAATELFGPNEALWVVMDGDELLACATAWLSTEGYVEVKLIGGRDRHRWLRELDEMIGAAARAAGATRLVANGRRGWLRELQRLGWERIGELDGMFFYSRGV
jgi:hypothetical protein